MSARTAHEPEDHDSFAAYLATEAASEVRHELVGGRAVLMSGGTRAHDMAAFWMARRLADAYEPRGCVVFIHDRRLRIAGASYYPDVFVQCGPGADEQYETDAALVVEVLSPDSRLRDRREKAEAYRRLSSLQAYLVVDPDQPRVEVYRREGAEWVWRVFGPGKKVELDALVLDVDSLYDHIGTRA